MMLAAWALWRSSEDRFEKNRRALWTTCIANSIPPIVILVLTLKSDQSLIPPGYPPPQVWYATNATSSLNLTIPIAGAPGPGGTTFVLYDVVNAGAYDATMGRSANAYTTSSPTQLVTHMPDA